MKRKDRWGKGGSENHTVQNVLDRIGDILRRFPFPLLTSNEIDAIVFVFLRVMRTC